MPAKVGSANCPPRNARPSRTWHAAAPRRPAPSSGPEIVLAAAEGLGPRPSPAELGVSRPTVYTWLEAVQPPGTRRPARHAPRRTPGHLPPGAGRRGPGRRLTDPAALGLPFASWTLDRLRAYLNEHKAIPIKRSRIDEILLAEGLRWRQQESWFGERVDPDFAAKRGRSSGSTPNHPRMRSSSASTRWGRPSQDLPRPRARPRRARGRARRRPPARRAGQAGGRDRPAAAGRVRLRGLPAGDRRGVHALLRERTGPTGSTSWSASRRGCPADVAGCTRSWTTCRRTARPTCCCSRWAPRVGVRVPADVRGVPEPDRAVVEGAQVAGAGRGGGSRPGRSVAAFARRRRTGTGTGTRSSGAGGAPSAAEAAGSRGRPGRQGIAG
jgi:transposase